jgi:GNAT superfamily N-acetyltransferase
MKRKQMTINQLYIAIKIKYKQFGIIGTFNLFIKKLCFILLRCRITVYWQLKYNIYYQQHCENALMSKLDIRELVYSDFLQGDKLRFGLRLLEIIKQRLQNGQYYYPIGVVDKGILVYSSWIMLPYGSRTEDIFGIPLDADEALLLDDYCHVDYRGKGIHSTILNVRLNKIRELGKKKGVIYIMDGNRPAMTSIIRLGFKVTGKIKRIEVGCKKYYKYKFYN